MRKEQDEDHEIDQIAFRRHFATVDIDHVVDRLERVEGNADRQDDAEYRHRRRRSRGLERLFQGLQEEVRVLEVTEQTEIADQIHAQKPTTRARRRTRFDAKGEEVIDHSGNADDRGKPLVPTRVEIETGRQQHPYSHALIWDQPVDDKETGEELNEFLGTKEHGFLAGHVE